MRNTALLLLFSCLAFGAACTKDDETTRSSRTEPVASQPPDADNTARNDKKSPDALASTDAQDQSESDADLKITSSIRESVMRDKSLSTNAHNVKIITSSGKVTLRGPVKTERERSKIEAYAKLVTGVNGVDNMLEVEKNP